MTTTTKAPVLSQLTEGGKALIHILTHTAEALVAVARGDQGPDVVAAANWVGG